LCSVLSKSAPLNHSEKTRIGGIKFSEELIHVAVSCSASQKQELALLLNHIAKESITLPFYTSSVADALLTANFCAHSSELKTLEKIVYKGALSSAEIQITPSVGLLTLFPHRNSLSLLGKIVQLIADFQFPLYSFSTSISAFAINTAYEKLDELSEKLQTLVELPENHAPFRSQFRIKQLDQTDRGI
jgi:hypothetical protein